MPLTRAFSLIELLVALSVVALLTGMLMPVLAVAQRSANKSATEAVLRKVEAGLTMYKGEVGGFPYQQDTPSDAGSVAISAWPNRLNHFLGGTPSSTDLAKILADGQAAANAFRYSVTLKGEWTAPIEPSSFTSNATYRMARVITTGKVHIDGNGSERGGSDNVKAAVSLANNLMAQERSRMQALVGQLEIDGPVIHGPNGLIGDWSAARALTAASASSAANPGYAIDYFNGELERRFISNESVLDAWGNNLVYVCRTTPGIAGTTLKVVDATLSPYDTKRYGLGAQGFRADEGPSASLKSANRHMLLYRGRVVLSATDAGVGAPTPTDSTYLPSLNDLMDSDVRYYAAPGYELVYELWSPGRDGAFACQRKEKVNVDNVAAQQYNRGLK